MQYLSSLLLIDKTKAEPVYLQIASKLMGLIKDGTLPAGHRLPSTRQLSLVLNLHRKTIIRAFDELLAQGWLESYTGSGTFVAKHLPEIKPKPFSDDHSTAVSHLKTAGFPIYTSAHLDRKLVKQNSRLHLDDGYPDSRLAPLDDLSRAYRTQLLIGSPYERLGYGDPKGSEWLREELSVYLNETRGLKTTAENILIVRGAVMGVYLGSTGLIKPGDLVAVGDLSWRTADTNFIQAGAKLIRIPIDEYGIDIDELEKACQQQPLRMVYVTSHHHYPTTVGLRADRRISLLQLSEKYGFIIFEDDYDYDFHYQNKPLLPLASADHAGMVLYCGSFTKAISPAFRVGYLVGSENVISHLAQLRMIIDRQGDIVLENTIAELLQNGIIQRHLRKSLRLYKQRRDVFCELMKDKLSDKVEFQIPDGGMAVWTKFDPQINLIELAEKALKKGLYFSSGFNYNPTSVKPNATRLGFASSTIEELIQSIDILSSL